MGLRLLKVMVQPTWVYDDGESLTEVTVEPYVVSAAEWPTHAADQLPVREASMLAEVEAQLAQQPTPNRAERRAATKSNGKAKTSVG